MRSVFELIDRIKGTNTTEDVKAALVQLLEITEFDYFLVGIVIPHSITTNDIFILDNYPTDWRQQYDELDLVKLDPIVSYSMNNYMPMIWSQVSQDKRYSKNEMRVMQKAHSAGLQAGFSVPIHSRMGEFGMISLALSQGKTESIAHFNNAIPLVQLIIPVLQDALKRINTAQEIVGVQLTKRESECLTWAAEGKSSWEISQILNCSERTVLFHLNNAGHKLNASNRYQSISKAILTGAINVAL